MTDYEALAQRVEREEPSRELTVDVLEAFGWQTMKGDVLWVRRKGAIGWQDAPDPLHSLDAAASLVPPGWIQLIVGWRHDLGVVSCELLGPRRGMEAAGTAPDEKRARTAAALRAQAMEMKDE